MPNTNSTISTKDVEKMYKELAMAGVTPSRINDYLNGVALGDVTRTSFGTIKNMRNPPVEPLQMIAMRLRISQGMRLPFEFIQAHMAKEVAFVFVVNKDSKAVILEDELDLFPSDKLITQLRMLQD